MKNKRIHIFSLLLSFVFVAVIFAGCGGNKKSTSTVTTVKLNEVARSVFYAPMYAAINQGFFKEEGINIDLSTGQGADKTMQQVLSKSCDIGFCGPEQVIYINNQNKEDYPVLFAELTQTDGSFLVGRHDIKDFKWEDVKGKSIIGGRPGGVPEMSLEYVLKNHGIQPGKDVNLLTNIAYTATAGAFKAGTGDYVALFEPTGSMLQQDKSGYIVASIGKSAGIIPYTCYFSTKSYMDKNPQIIEKFTKAIYKGQIWIQNHNDEEVAKSIKSFFPGTDESIIVSVIKNYRSINAFASTPVMKEENLNRLMDIIQSYNQSLIPQRPAFSKIVNNSFAEKAIK
ncbi:ABC transporter substrate-binding protein [Clostridium drakei]|uniref:Nitrate ABC transporter substrate-binding protein n=1 Tax=Clostridium drakei TaxID=332101 RepID=A0A2U8DW64_9CLOT|nr:ABC transporter substrate-binding protein [Clostridium drakei]AWI06956.1 nitrate ABC transporter substrate-binding protein [Clostridium drakei]